MTDAAMIAPVFVHVVLVVALVIATGRGRVAAVKAGEVTLKDIALDSSRWPERLRKLSNNYQNQFELPVLFYAGVALLIATGLADGISLVFAWGFVASRLVHSFIHVGTNNVVHRLYAFGAGLAALVALWLWFGLRLYVIG
ncbi:MAG TPA: MAPEG family protein [Aestuariivirgaceae bacterium]|nr:MAPEG family protein [Aestuariivirgaceae bacterium]